MSVPDAEGNRGFYAGRGARDTSSRGPSDISSSSTYAPEGPDHRWMRLKSSKSESSSAASTRLLTRLWRVEVSSQIFRVQPPVG